MEPPCVARPARPTGTRTGFATAIDFIVPFSAFSRRNQTDKAKDMVSSWPPQGG
jgi:hypothetical protein